MKKHIESLSRSVAKSLIGFPLRLLHPGDHVGGGFAAVAFEPVQDLSVWIEQNDCGVAAPFNVILFGQAIVLFGDGGRKLLSLRVIDVDQDKVLARVSE